MGKVLLTFEPEVSQGYNSVFSTPCVCVCVFSAADLKRNHAGLAFASVR